VPVLLAVFVVLCLLIGFLIRERSRPFRGARSRPDLSGAASAYPPPRTLIDETPSRRALIFLLALGGLTVGLAAYVAVGGRTGAVLLLVIAGPPSIIAHVYWARSVERAVDRAIDVSTSLDPDQRADFLRVAEQQWGRRATRRLRQTGRHREPS
jgi:hypothetical protein